MGLQLLMATSVGTSATATIKSNNWQHWRRREQESYRCHAVRCQLAAADGQLPEPEEGFVVATSTTHDSLPGQICRHAWKSCLRAL